MCAIIDANVASQLWQDGGTPAGQALRAEVEKGRVPMVVGGHLREELWGAGDRMRQWLVQLQNAGHLTTVDREEVDRVAQELKASRGPVSLTSDDEHVVALAMVSGARLLFTNDMRLSQDFKNPQIVPSPRGRVYTTRRSQELNESHRRLLRRTDLCRRAR